MCCRPRLAHHWPVSDWARQGSSRHRSHGRACKKVPETAESSRQLEVDTKVATVRELLEVLDELERAGDALQEDSPASRTLSAISSKFETRLRGMGFERVETLGQPFDPQLHSMVTQGRASSEAPREPEVIVEELESGWILGNTVVRPALVSTQH